MSVQHGAWGVASCNFQPPLSKNPRSAAGYTQMGELERAKYIMRFSRLQLRTSQCAMFKHNTAEVADTKPQELSEKSIVETTVGPA